MSDQIDPHELGFMELTGADGSALWVVAGSAYGVEKPVNEAHTLLKTASELFVVAEAPAGIFREMQAVMLAQSSPHNQFRDRLTGEEQLIEALKAHGLAYVTQPADPILVERMLRADEVVIEPSGTMQPGVGSDALAARLREAANSGFAAEPAADRAADAELIGQYEDMAEASRLGLYDDGEGEDD